MSIVHVNVEVSLWLTLLV